MANRYKEYMETPTASMNITSNGTYDVIEKAEVVVNATKPEETFTVNPTTSSQTITPTAGSVFSSGVVNAIPVSPLDNTIISGQAFEEATGDYAWKSTVQVPEGYHAAQTLEKTFSEIFPAPTTEGTAAEMLLGYELFNHSGQKITGTMPNNATASITLDGTTTSYTVPAGYHTGSDTVSIVTETKSTDPTTSAQTITPTTGKVLTSVSVSAIQTETKTATTNNVTITPTAGKYLTSVSVTLPTYNGEIV